MNLKDEKNFKKLEINTGPNGVTIPIWNRLTK